MRGGKSPPPDRGCPETELLLCCARATLSDPIAARIRELAQAGLDWELLTRTAAPQGVTALLYRALHATCCESVPETVLRDLSYRFQSNARRNLLLARELLRLVALYKARGIRVIPFKGPLLTAAAYSGNLALRHFYDLDFLVQPADVTGAKEVLRSQGYQPEFTAVWEYHFIEPRGRWLVDLHERIVPEYFPAVGSFNELWGRGRPLALLNEAVPTLAPEDLLLVVSVQLAKDCREWKQRLVQICDTAELIRSHPDLDWESIVHAARTSGALRMLFFDLHLATGLLGAQLPGAIAEAVRADSVVTTLAAEVRARLFPEAEGPTEAVQYRNGGILREDSRFHLRVRERWRDKLDYMFRFSRNHIRLIINPTDRDRQFLWLPRRLGFLYYLVRPVRVVVQWFRTGQLRSRPRGRAVRPERRDF